MKTISERIPVEQKILKANDILADQLRRRFESAELLCLNLISSPGSGKTSLLERTLALCVPRWRMAVLTGDIQTDLDAQRMARFGFPVKQICTAGVCHLDAGMIHRAVEDWQLDDIDILFIENVGNLVCPSSYDLGEHHKVAVLSVTEGEDKPAKYPAAFHKASCIVLNKIDLLPYVPFDVDRARRCAEEVHPGIPILPVSCTTGEGFEEWFAWLEAQRQSVAMAA